MKLDTNSNLYTIVYACVLVVIVAFLLAFVSSALKERSEANERIDKKKQILAALRISAAGNVEEEYAAYVVADPVVDSEGAVKKENGGFAVSRKEISPDCLPVYICMVDGATKYVIPLSGKGLWGSIWGYLAVDNDGQTVYGAYFSHESETAGLGALISEKAFQSEFQGKQLFAGEGTVALKVVKHGQVKDEAAECDGISGATLTGQGVQQMIETYVAYYRAFLIEAAGGGADLSLAE